MNKELTTLFTGRRSVILDEVDSTNSFLALSLKEERLPEGTVVRALKQSAGRGQSGSHWESETAKNLLLSFVFYPSFIVPKDVFILNKTFALAVHDFTRFWIGESVRIKWPNDIYHNNMKLAGMLVENSINTSSITHSILGIGINVNQRKFSSSLPNPVSLSSISGYDFVIDELFESLCSFIEARYLQLKSGGNLNILSEYNNALYARNEWRKYSSAGNFFEGKILSVDENGRLLIENRKGEVLLFNSKEVAFVF